MSWNQPAYGMLFLAVIAVIYLLWRLSRWQKSVIKNFADAHLVANIFSHKTSQLVRIKNIFLVLSLFFLVLALMGPMWGEEEQKIKREGIDIVFAIDVSNSMNAEDVAPSRLEKAKKFIERYVNQLGGDRVGLVIFAGDAYIASPLTSDYSSIESYIDALQVELVANQGTNLTAAIDKSVEVLGKNPQTSKAIVLISDGEDHESGIEEAIKQAKKNHIDIFTLGIGGTSPVPVPIYDQYGDITYKKDKNGETVLTSFHGEELREIAKEADGAYIKIESIEKAVNKLKSEINTLQKKSSSEILDINKKQQFQWFLAVSILFFFMYNLTPDKKINT